MGKTIPESFHRLREEAPQMCLGQVVERQTPLEIRGSVKRRLRFPCLQTTFHPLIVRSRVTARLLDRQPFR